MIDRLRKCRSMLYLHGLIHKSEAEKIHYRIEKLQAKRIREGKV